MQKEPQINMGDFAKKQRQSGLSLAVDPNSLSKDWLTWKSRLMLRPVTLPCLRCGLSVNLPMKTVLCWASVTVCPLFDFLMFGSPSATFVFCEAPCGNAFVQSGFDTNGTWQQPRPIFKLSYQNMSVASHVETAGLGDNNNVSTSLNINGK